MKRLIVFLTMAAVAVQAQTWQRVAHDDAGVAGQEVHLLEGSDYTYTEKDLPGSAPDRTVAFGEAVVFGYGGLATGAAYRAQLTLLSDHEVREQRLLVNGRVVREKLVLPAGAPVRETVEVPAGAGALEIRLEKISGPNAVVSAIDIESTDPRALTSVTSDKVGRWVDARPRYTARPADVVSLNGTWSFSAAGPTGADWKPIEVPGEWVMQGFTVPPNQFAGYRRTFTVPPAFAGQRVLLRFDGVYSEATVTLNDRELGRHLGGFTAFEFDVTDALRPGENTLALAVRNESLADRMASGTKYAEHPLGGIPRKVTLFAVPAVHVAGLEVTATPDESLARGTARVAFQVVNDGPSATLALTATAKLEPSGATTSVAVGAVAAGGRGEVVIDLPVEQPVLWDTEHPNLYTLTLSLSSGQAVRERVGFKRIEVRGNEVFVNNRPIKIRGGCRHETHPTRGRSLTPELWRRDAELYREANFNTIRTSHYPPAEEFVAACDELGLFVECEAPMCWSGTDEGYILGATLEMLQTYRNHASVLCWSLANESPWCPAYRLSHEVLRTLDPSRPTTVEYPHGDNDQGTCEIASTHYPGPGGPDRYRAAKRPTNYGEYCHLNAYNRFELSADPGVRDAWGRGFRKMWDAMFLSQGTLGGSLWAAMDDTFHLPDGRSVGYGTWGPLDNWRRPKPEYWHAKKAYSPVRIDESRRFLPPALPITLAVLNQSDFSDLGAFDLRWTLGDLQGKAEGALAPHARGTLTIVPPRAPRSGETLRIEVRDPRGFVADEYAFIFGEAPVPEPVRPAAAAAFAQDGDRVVLVSGPTPITVSRTTGQLAGPVADAALMILPLNNGGGTQMGGKYVYPPDNRTATNWKLAGVEVQPGVVTVSGEYAEAKGTFTYTVDAAGAVCVAYRFTMKKDVNPRQVGLVFGAPRACDTIAWERNAPYTAYPTDHIGRAAGTARAFGGQTQYEAANLRAQPTRPWCEDATPGGTQDFRSTKENILRYALTDTAGSGVEVRSDGRQHARAWVDGEQVRLLVADYSNAGAEGFFRGHASREDRPLKAGAEISGVVRLRLLPAPPRP